MSEEPITFNSRLIELFDDNLMRKSRPGQTETEKNEVKATNQTELASKIHISRQSISKYIHNNSTPSLDIAIMIANYYNVSLDYLAGLSQYKSLSPRLKSACMFTGLSEQAASLLNSKIADKAHPLFSEIASFFIESDAFGKIVNQLERALISGRQYQFLYDDSEEQKTNLLETQEFQFNKELSDVYRNVMMELDKKLDKKLDKIVAERWKDIEDAAATTIEKMEFILGELADLSAANLQHLISEESAESGNN